jgi:hypothetical protein
MGNHDEFLLDAELVRPYTAAPQVVASINWTRYHLSRVELDFLRGFERSCEITLAKSTVQLSPAHRARTWRTSLASTPPAALDAMLAGTTATIPAGGHTHIQMLRQHHGRLLVNPGSVGLALKDYAGGRILTILSHAEYAMMRSLTAR